MTGPGAAMLVGAPRPAEGAGGPDVDIIVVGGGLAGMAAALAAADGGASVLLVERRRRLGGLTWSFERHGLRFDNGQHVFLRCCTAYRDLIDRIGASGDVVLQDRLSVPVLRPGGRSATIARTGLPSPAHLAAAVARYDHLSVADRLRLGPAIAALRRLDPADPTLDTQTFGAWLGRHHQSPRSVAALWDLITVPTVNLPADQASLAMAVKVFRSGLLDANDGADIGWSAVPLGDLHGERGAAALDRAGVTVALGARVTAVSARPGGGHTVAAEDGRQWRADAVVVAVPPSAAAALLPGRLPAVEELGTSPIVDVHLVLDRRVTDLSFFAAVGSPVQFVFDRTEAVGLDRRRGQVLALSLSAAEDLVGCRPAVLVDRFVAALGALLPAMVRARLLDAVVTKEHAATFRAVPGSAALRPVPGPVGDGLAVAGAWCATGWPATMEGAVLAGRAAVAALLDDSPPATAGMSTASPTATTARSTYGPRSGPPGSVHRPWRDQRPAPLAQEAP